MYVITVLFEIEPVYYGAFLSAVTSNAQASLAGEPGCQQFDVCTPSTNSNTVFLYEVYDSKSDFDVHLASAHFLAFSALVQPWVREKTVTAFNRASA